MPIYEYKCRECAEPFELLVLKGTVVACPACQSANVEQLLSGFAVSSEGTRSANALASRQAQVKSKDHIEQNVAHAEYVKKHADE
jgi:putative FmdB family regulatory protein